MCSILFIVLLFKVISLGVSRMMMTGFFGCKSDLLMALLHTAGDVIHNYYFFCNFIDKVLWNFSCNFGLLNYLEIFFVQGLDDIRPYFHLLLENLSHRELVCMWMCIQGLQMFRSYRFDLELVYNGILCILFLYLVHIVWCNRPLFISNLEMKHARINQFISKWVKIAPFLK